MTARAAQSTRGLFVYLLLLWTGARGQVCDKFSSESSMLVTVIDGTCYYARTDVDMPWGKATEFCADKETHLVHLQTKQKQFAVYKQLGLTVNQHWVGLRFENGTWWWYQNSGDWVNATSDVQGRMNAGAGDTAYATTSNMASLTPGPATMSYRALCEDSAAVTSSPGEQVEVMSGLFLQQTILTTAQHLKDVTSPSKTVCASYCLLSSGCRHFVFTSSTLMCSVYEENESPTSMLPTCGAAKNCFSRIDYVQ